MTPLLLAAVLSGLVVDHSGAPVAGALVTAAEQRTARTNERGEFRFADLPAGTYRLEIEMPGFFRERPPAVTLAATDEVRLPTVTLEDRTVQARRDGFFEFPDLAPGECTCIRSGEAVELDGWITPDSSSRVLRQPKRRQPTLCL